MPTERPRQYHLVFDDRACDIMRQRGLVRPKIRSVGLSTKAVAGVDRDSNIYSELTVVKSPRAPMYEIQYVKTKKDGIQQVPVLRSQTYKLAIKGRDKGPTKSKKAEEDQPEVDETGSVVSDKSVENTDDMVGVRVIACNKRDGLYYPGTVANHLEATYAVVNFNFNKRQKVRTHMIIPMSGAIPRPELAAGDFVLVKVFKKHISLDCYVPAIIEFVPEDFRAQNKFYSVLLYNGQRDSTMRKFIVKIGRARFEMAVNYIAHVQSIERSKRALSDTTPRSQDTPTSKTMTEGSERSNRSEDEQSDRSSIRSSDRSSVRSGSERGRKKKEKVTKKLVRKKEEEEHGKSRSEGTSEKHVRPTSRSKTRSLSRSRSRSGSESERTYSRSSNNTQTSTNRGGRHHSRSRRRSESESNSRSRSRSSSRSYSSRSRSEMSNESWSKSRSRNRRRSRSSSGSSTVKSGARSLSNDSQDRTPPASPIERPVNPVPKPRPRSRTPEEKTDENTEARRSQTSDSLEKTKNDEKDKLIGELQYQLDKQLRKQMRQDRRLIRQARKINKIQQKLRHSDQNSSINSEKIDRGVKPSSDTDGSPRRRKESPDGTSYSYSADSPNMRKTVAGREVLARWSDDGWYYIGRVSETNESGCNVMDALKCIEKISHEDILSLDGNRYDAFQPQDNVIALHPKYVFSYAPGEILQVFDNGNVSVEFYDGNVVELTPDEVFKVSKDKYKKDVEYIVEKEKGLIGKSVVARDDRTGTYRLGVVDSRVGVGQQYYLKWLDGDICKQTSVHIFEVSFRKINSQTSEHVLAPIDNRCVNYKPAVVIQHSPLHLQFFDGSSNSETKEEQCFGINKEYYTNAVGFLLSRQGYPQP